MEKVTLSRADWPLYKREARLALVALAVGLTAVTGSYWLYTAANQSRLKSEAARDAARNTLANAENERAELLASLPLYKDLVERSIIGSEKRLNWHETLKAERDRLPMAGVTFTLAPQTPFNVDSAGNPLEGGLFKRLRSTMTLSAEFQREEAFVAFLEYVASKAHALPIVRGCRLARARQSEGHISGNIEAECLIDWTTLERTNAPGGTGAS